MALPTCWCSQACKTAPKANLQSHLHHQVDCEDDRSSTRSFARRVLVIRCRLTVLIISFSWSIISIISTRRTSCLTEWKAYCKARPGFVLSSSWSSWIACIRRTSSSWKWGCGRCLQMLPMTMRVNDELQQAVLSCSCPSHSRWCVIWIGLRRFWVDRRAWLRLPLMLCSLLLQVKDSLLFHLCEIGLKILQFEVLALDNILQISWSKVRLMLYLRISAPNLKNAASWCSFCIVSSCSWSFCLTTVISSRASLVRLSSSHASFCTNCWTHWSQVA